MSNLRTTEVVGRGKFKLFNLALLELSVLKISAWSDRALRGKMTLHCTRLANFMKRS